MGNWEVERGGQDRGGCNPDKRPRNEWQRFGAKFLSADHREESDETNQQCDGLVGHAGAR